MVDVPEVKVLALSPHCWPVSPFCYMDEPGRFFSVALSSPLDEFADFCRRSECHGSGCAWGVLPGPSRSTAGQAEAAGVLGCAGSARQGWPPALALMRSLAGQSQLGWECTRPRRLQWTWLGYAELQFGDCVLHVSTLQMYILLCFNSTEVGAGAAVG